MIIEKNTFTREALKFVTPNKAYDREFLAMDVAKSLAKQLYDELGASMAMSLLDVDHLEKAFYTAAKSLIDWTRCNQKVQPQEYADSIEYDAWPKPIGGEL